jgi:hypothetical protein
MEELAKLLRGIFAPAEDADPFAKFLRDGNEVTRAGVKIVLGDRGFPFKWSRYECLHCEDITIRFQDGHYLLFGRGRFEMDNWYCTSQGDVEQKADRPCTINLAFAWPASEVKDSSEGVSFIPGRIREVVGFLRAGWEQAKHAEPGAAADRGRM